MSDSSQSQLSREFFAKFCKIFYLIGTPNFWIENHSFSKSTQKILHTYYIFCTVLTVILIFMEWGAMITQTNLNEKQSSDLVLFCMYQTIMHSNFLRFFYKKNQIQKLLWQLVVESKMVHNDLEVENQMIKKAKLFTVIFSGFCCSSLIFYGLDGFAQVLTSPDATFTTLITAWPDVKDLSKVSGVARVVIYICWWIFLVQISVMYFLVIYMTICLSHQFKNICRYFESLNAIFETGDSQKEKEWKYEEGLKTGIKLHVDVLRYFREYQSICTAVFGSHISMNVLVVVLLLFQMVNSERSAANTFTIVFTILSVLLSGTGGLMWNAGDITVEASRLPTAIYLSGWQHCRSESSVKVRKLLTIAALVSQKPVVLKAFGIIEMSYDSYVSIVKSSYSIFSVVY